MDAPSCPLPSFPPRSIAVLILAFACEPRLQWGYRSFMHIPSSPSSKEKQTAQRRNTPPQARFFLFFIGSPLANSGVNTHV